jgi:GMP reductase
MFTCVEECAKSDVPIIADGGVKGNGDIAKALVAGAHMVMAGSLFSACEDSPGDPVYLGGTRRGKKYFGSASEKNKGNKRHIEGVEKVIESNYMTYKEKMAELKEDIQSSISYAGGSTLNAFKKVDWIVNY